MKLTARRTSVATAVVLLCALFLASHRSPGAVRASDTKSPTLAPCGSQQPCGVGKPASLPISLFDNGALDGRIAMGSRPAGIGGRIEIEPAHDFVTTSTVRISNGRFTGLMPTSASFGTIQQVDVEIYRVFPLDSVNPPSGRVPTRVNSPSDVAFDSRSTASASLTFMATLLAPTFNATNSVLNGINPTPNQTTGGEGPVSGEEVQFDVTLNPPIQLAPGQYFFVPLVGLSSGNFYWLSAAGPTISGDLQAWIRNANLSPDWLRVGTDIVGGTAKFNGAFALSGTRVLKTFLPLIRR